jgi:urea transporter
MPREIKQLLVSVTMLATAVCASVALIALDNGRDWVVNFCTMPLVWALFLPADYEEE